MKALIKRRHYLKNKLRNRQRIFAAWTSLGHPSITEIFCQAAFDFIGIDIEHSTISHEQCQRIIAAAQAGGSLCLARIASHNLEMVKRLLDSGADGIIVPMVETPQEVQAIIQAMRYAPKGKRSFGVARAQGYGFDFELYAKEWNRSSILMVQIESQLGVDNIEEILSFDEVDAVMIGPYDLSGSLGIPGQLEHQRVKDLCQRIIRACKKYKRSCGTQNIDPDLKSLRKNLSQGYTFVVLASDIFVLWRWTDRMGGLMKKLRKARER